MAGPVPPLPGYEILAQIGAGATASVYRARRAADGVDVAIKVTVPLSREQRALIVREVQVMEDLNHPNIVRLLHWGQDDERVFLVMDLCRGGDLEELRRSRGGKLPVREAVGIIVKALDGLVHMHARTFIHRDIKPSNILLADVEGQSPKIADFGLSKTYILARLSNLTRTGTSAGSVPYMSREQVVNFQEVKPVSDVYSMGATLYALLTGYPPRDFPLGRCDESMVSLCPVVPVRTRAPELPEALAAVVDRAVANMKKNRYSRAADFQAELAAALP